MPLACVTSANTAAGGALFWDRTAAKTSGKTSIRQRETELSRTPRGGSILIGPVGHPTRCSLPLLEFCKLLQGFGGFRLVLHLVISTGQQKVRTWVFRVQAGSFAQRLDGFLRLP